MILKSLRVQNYKAIEDSTEFSIDQVTCLVGKNEAGKTALLQALYKLNPVVDSDTKFDEVEEYPRRYLSDYQDQVKSDSKEVATVLTTQWELEDADREAVDLILGPHALVDNVVRVTKGYDNVRRWTVSINEKQIAKHFLDQAELSAKEEKQAAKTGSIADLIQHLAKLESPSERATALLANLRRIFPDENAATKVRQLLAERLPTFLYFANYERMPGQVAIDELQGKKNENRLQLSDRIFIALLDLVGTTPEEIRSIARSEQLIAKLEAVSNRLTREIFTYWSQNKHLKVSFRFDAASPQDPPPFNSGFVFRTRIENTRHGVTVGFDERSVGFVWFFSFLVWFSQVRENYGENLFILLDEPGLSLHGKAQEDLVRYINERLRPNYQVIYTTHSPFMVDPEHLTSVRTVEDVVKDDEILGTKVGDKIFSTDEDTVFPLQAAMGYSLTQSLFVGKNVMLVEGPSDLLYLKWFSRELQARGREYLDSRWVITPVGGIDKMGPFASLFGGNKLHIAVFTDFHQGAKQRIKSLRESELLKLSHVFTAEMYAGQDEADIEDLLGRSLYTTLVNRAYALDDKHSLPVQKPDGAPLCALKEVEAHFRTLPPNLPEFDHYTPAAFLVERTAELRQDPLDLEPSLERFEKLFRDLNKLLPNG